MIEFLQGKKTNIIAFLIAVNTFVGAMGWVDPSITEKVNWFLGAIAGTTLHAAITRTKDAR